jgi:serine/threonine protein phosphatase PrpC
VEIFGLGNGRIGVAVADGMGGHEGGGIASRIAVSAFRNAMLSDDDDTGPAALGKAFLEAGAAVAAAALESGKKDMGTTLVAAVVQKDDFWVAHTGDSPAVLVTSDRVLRLTEDHTLIADAVRAGQLTEIEAINHPFRHAVSRTLEDEEIEPDIRRVSRSDWAESEGAVLLLGTDGLFGHLGDVELLDILSRAADPDAACKMLVLRAIQNGSDDNATVAAIEVGNWRYPGTAAHRWLLPCLLAGLVAALVLTLLLRNDLTLHAPARAPASRPKRPVAVHVPTRIAPAAATPSRRS